ncbi:GrpB family protein [Sinorhizobium meliloti]|uniref:GrpB family protein n=1 Tax=Rhizobium meliloti TaxID=382 RepID=UPI003D64692A
MPTLVELVPHDPNWAQTFSAAEEVLRKALGCCVLAVDHVGSTAVPGIAAKPIIDIDVTLSSLTDVPGAGADLIRAGFEPRGNRYDDDVWAFLLRSSEPHLRVYLCPPANRTHERRILFRNYLRQNGEAAARYSILKRRLADQFPYDGDRYTSEKSQFITDIVSKAQEDTR